MAYERWKEITDDLYILDVIREGYKLPLMVSHPDICLKNNRSARENMPFVQQEVESLIKKVSCHRWRKFQKLLTRSQSLTIRVVSPVWYLIADILTSNCMFSNLNMKLLRLQKLCLKRDLLFSRLFSKVYITAFVLIIGQGGLAWVLFSDGRKA